MPDAPRFDVVALGNAIVDVIAPADDAFLVAQGLEKGAMGLVDAQRSAALYSAMAPGVETSGGSAANTVAGVASLSGRAAYVGMVADDALGAAFTRDMTGGGVHFVPTPLAGAATGACMVNVTPDGQRTMATFLGAASQLTAADVDLDTVRAGAVVYLEGYLFDPPPAREAFAVAARAARGGRTHYRHHPVGRLRGGALARRTPGFPAAGRRGAGQRRRGHGPVSRPTTWRPRWLRWAQRVRIAAVTDGGAGVLRLLRGRVHAGGGRLRRPGARHHRRGRPVRGRLPVRPGARGAR